jgi:hypothetical protein
LAPECKDLLHYFGLLCNFPERVKNDKNTVAEQGDHFMPNLPGHARFYNFHNVQMASLS